MEEVSMLVSVFSWSHIVLTYGKAPLPTSLLICVDVVKKMRGSSEYQVEETPETNQPSFVQKVTISPSGSEKGVNPHQLV